MRHIIEKVGDRFVIYDEVNTCDFCGCDLAEHDSATVCLHCEDILDRFHEDMEVCDDDF